MQKIDVFAHILPAKFVEALYKKTPARHALVNHRPGICDLDMRFRIMDRHEGYTQILNISGPPLEEIADLEVAADLAKIANDSMAELVMKYPERFLAAVACLPMPNMDAVLKEIDRAIIELGFRGIQITTNIMDKPLDSPEFEPLFERMNYYQLSILLHPVNMRNGPRAFHWEGQAIKDKVDNVGQLAENPFGWPYETTIAMGRLVWSGLLEKYPNLKIITHHCGGLTPYQANRISEHQSVGEILIYKERNSNWHFTKRPIDYYKMMYADTAVWGNTSVLMCGYDFFGSDHILFGTDMAYGAEGGARYVRETIRSVQDMTISDEIKKKIFEDNPRKLFHLPVEV
jgi:aminocarboxymuconate-semialdehyde decarboxylase